ncbi:hypothetical protein SS50377_25457 [Spironucleus salmonicida]|uniref:Uncharacterized protein n=1 Tax=Spironucleus salmonicida TaxID=348837 RepID=V6LK56_9EUKA|nr:hypothetical protein SS50377_25457 [Spironucleus salmonicida]|eukprot:EST45005.1 hypothetical protein SS50377_15024 [Spironucleus salmonicida]
MSTQSVKKIMERAQALKQRLSQSEDSQQQIVPQAATNQTIYSQQKPLVPKQQQIDPIYLQKQKVLVIPNQDVPFLCLLAITQFSYSDNLVTLSPTNSIDNVKICLCQPPYTQTDDPTLLFDFQEIQQISAQLQVQDQGESYIIGTAPILTKIQLNDMILTEQNKRKYSRKTISVVEKYHISIKANKQDSMTQGGLIIGQLECILFAGGQNLIEFQQNIINKNNTLIKQYQALKPNASDFNVQTEDQKIIVLNDMENFRKVGLVQIILRISQLAFKSDEEFTQIYVNFSLQPDSKMQALIGFQNRNFLKNDQKQITSKSFPVTKSKNIQVSEINFSVGLNMNLTQENVNYLKNGHAFLAIFGISNQKIKKLIGHQLVQISQSQDSKWISLKQGGYVFGDLSIIKGSQLEDFISYEQFINQKGLPMEYEFEFPIQEDLYNNKIQQQQFLYSNTVQHALTGLNYTPFKTIEKQDIQQILRSKVNPLLSQVGPLRSGENFQSEIGQIMNIGNQIEDLFNED